MTLHVIYGIACAGKSITALRYASDNGIRTVISTDYLREVQKLYVPADQAPALAKVSHTAWELTGDPTPSGIIAGFTRHAEAVFPAVQAVAIKLARDGLDAVIEGSCFHGAPSSLGCDGRSGTSPSGLCSLPSSRCRSSLTTSPRRNSSARPGLSPGTGGRTPRS
jgi:hypothetical protein